MTASDLNEGGSSLRDTQRATETPVVADHDSVGIGDIWNYYGGLNLKREGGVDYWSIENYNGDHWYVVPEHVAAALRTLIPSRATGEA